MLRASAGSPAAEDDFVGLFGHLVVEQAGDRRSEIPWRPGDQKVRDPDMQDGLALWVRKGKKPCEPVVDRTVFAGDLEHRDEALDFGDRTRRVSGHAALCSLDRASFNPMGHCHPDETA